MKGRRIEKSFDNISEMKRYARNTDSMEKKRLYGLNIYDLKTHDIVGTISGETRNYKTEPKKLPKKYDFISEYNTYMYGGWCPA